MVWKGQKKSREKINTFANHLKLKKNIHRNDRVRTKNENKIYIFKWEYYNNH